MTDTLTHDEHHDGGHHDADDHGGHWTDLQYVKLAIALAIVTAIEVALSYMVDDLGKAFLPLLLILMLVKFFAVVLFFMHLRFDSKVLTRVFYAGLLLAVAVYVIALMTFRIFGN